MESVQQPPPADFNGRLLAVVQGIQAARERYDYLTVARAMVHEAHLKSAEASRVLAENLGISRQSRHVWLQPESLAEWTKHWEERLEAAKPDGPPPTVVKHKITDEDWSWITGVVNEFGGRSWAKKCAVVKREAAKDASKAHLRGIHRSTLYRNRGRLSGHEERLRRERAAGAALQPTEPPAPSTNS